MGRFRFRIGLPARWVSLRLAMPALRLPECSAALRPIGGILPVQPMTLALASLSGREAGRFERATKITKTE